MPMPMMRVRKVLMRVGDRLMAVAVPVTRPCSGLMMVLMLMVLIVHVLMVVLDCLVRMLVGMSLCQMQPHTQRHERSGNEELGGNRL